MKRVRETIVVVEKQWVLYKNTAAEKSFNHKYVFTCSLSYPACKAYALYHIVICGLSGCTASCHITSYHKNVVISFVKKLLNLNMCFDFLYNFFPGHFSF